MPPHTPVRAPRGAKVHAVLMSGDTVAMTLCRRKFQGWAVALEPVDCRTCLERLPDDQGNA